MFSADSNRKLVGARGEIAVRTHLEGLGWRILAANYRCAQGEMDLIAYDISGTDATIVFVEVKTRRSTRHGAAAEAVGPRKQRRLASIAAAYLAEQQVGGEEPACRFDVAEVMLGPDGLMQVELCHSAFISD